MFTSYDCPAMIQLRVAAFSEMLKQLSLASEAPDTYFLEWLELDNHLIVPM